MHKFSSKKWTGKQNACGKAQKMRTKQDFQTKKHKFTTFALPPPKAQQNPTAARHRSPSANDKPLRGLRSKASLSSVPGGGRVLLRFDYFHP
jgi:hypothetical protein